MKKIILAVLIVFLAVGVSAFIRLSTPNKQIIPNFNDDSGDDDDDDSDEDNDDDNSKIIGSSTLETKGSLVSLSILAEHNNQNDCWVSYNGKVYDLTSWLPNHPGSAGAISPYCGTSEEFSKAFTKQHKTSKVQMLMDVATLIGDFEIKGNI